MTNQYAFKQLHLYNNVLNLFYLFLSNLNNRKDITKSNIRVSDINAMMEVKKLVLNNLSSPPSLQHLAHNAAMSVSKLQKCFKHVYGKSITQYSMDEKMKLAKLMLESKKYNVSEVGYKLGYSNMSHFSESFRKQFNINPSSIITSL